MKKHKIEGFNEFWLDCQTASLYSLLYSKIKNYELFAYCNDYSYEMNQAVTLTGKGYHTISVSTDTIMERLWEFLFWEEKELELIGNKNAVDELKAYLDKGWLIFVGVDMYNWMPGSMSYHTYHHYHYSLLCGYEKDVFLVCDNNGEFQEFSVNEDVLIEAYSNCNKDEIPDDAIAVKLKEDFNGKVISYNEIKKNAKEILRSIEKVLEFDKSFWIYNIKDYKEEFEYDKLVMDTLRILCRMKANRLLFRYLYDKYLEASFLDISTEFYQIEKEWEKQRNGLLLYFYRENVLEHYLTINRKMRQLFVREKSVWQRVMELGGENIIEYAVKR